jgi:hypothetical protein
MRASKVVLGHGDDVRRRRIQRRHDDQGSGRSRHEDQDERAADWRLPINTAETYTGARVQRFIYKGVGPVRRANQRVVWPR